MGSPGYGETPTVEEKAVVSEETCDCTGCDCDCGCDCEEKADEKTEEI